MFDGTSRIAVPFASGYTENAIAHGGLLDPGVDLLSKPYSSEDLARKLRQVLEKAIEKRLRLAATDRTLAP